MPESTANVAIIEIGPEDDELPLVVVPFEHETVEDKLRLFASVRSAHYFLRD